MWAQAMATSEGSLYRRGRPLRLPSWSSGVPQTIILTCGWVERCTYRFLADQTLVQVEDLFQLHHHLVWASARWDLEERRHELLPASVGLLLGHSVERGLKAPIGLEGAEKEPVLPHEQRVVVPAAPTKGVQHLRPHRLVVPLVLPYRVLLHLEQEADPLDISASRMENSPQIGPRIFRLSILCQLSVNIGERLD